MSGEVESSQAWLTTRLSKLDGLDIDVLAEYISNLLFVEEEDVETSSEVAEERLSLAIECVSSAAPDSTVSSPDFIDFQNDLGLKQKEWIQSAQARAQAKEAERAAAKATALQQQREAEAAAAATAAAKSAAALPGTDQGHVMSKEERAIVLRYAMEEVTDSSGDEEEAHKYGEPHPDTVPGKQASKGDGAGKKHSGPRVVDPKQAKIQADKLVSKEAEKKDKLSKEAAKLERQKAAQKGERRG